jgi:hypothetical protein
MFLSKLLSGRNAAKTKLELLTEAWTNIQKYYETAAGIVFLLRGFFSFFFLWILIGGERKKKRGSGEREKRETKRDNLLIHLFHYRSFERCSRPYTHSLQFTKYHQTYSSRRD